MVKNGFYYCEANDCIYHKTDEGLDMLIGWDCKVFYPWLYHYEAPLKPISQSEIDNEEMIFIGE